MLTRLFGLLVFLTLCVTRAQALDVPISEFTLDNGMQIVVIEDHRAPVVTHSVWYRVGAADEVSGKTGLAHFLEHLLFKGTTRYPYGAYEKLLDLNGAEGNAFTTQDYTAYYQRVAVDRLHLMMDMEADRMQNLILTDANVLPELDVVREERRQRLENEPGALLGEQLDAAMYTAHPYGRPVIGWMSEVEKHTKEDALEFYRKHYTPANAVLVVAGDVNPEEVKALADKYYGVLKNTFTPVPRQRTPEPAPIVERRLIMTTDRTPTATLIQAYLTPSFTTQKNNDAVALDFLATIIGSGSQSRMYKALVIEQKLAVEAGSYFLGSMRDSGKLQIYGVPAAGVSPEKLEKAIDSLIDDIKKNGVTGEDISRVLEQALAEQVYALDDQSTLLRTAGAAIMADQPAKKAFDTSAWATITPDDIKRVANTYLKPANSVTAIMLPGAAQ